MRVMEIDTPLGPDVLLFHRMRATEELSRPGEYQLDLLSLKKDINLDEILGQCVTVKLALPDDRIRYFSGYVTRFAQGGNHGRFIRYSAVVRSWLWFLTRTADCRIFQDMTVPDIVKKVFADHPTADFKFELTGSYRKWNYCVQYRETDFNFISRLLEEEGIYYYVKHTDGHGTVVLTDSTTKHSPFEGYETISFIGPEQQVRPDLEHISTWDFSRAIQAGVYVHDDFDFQRPSVKLRTRKAISRSFASSDYEMFDYPGHYVEKPDGEHYAAVRLEELGTRFETAHAATNAKGVAVGSLFTLEAHSRDDQNCEHLVVAATYELEFSDYEAMPGGGGTQYRCDFVAMSSRQQFRPARTTPKPFVQGPQTAVVVGPAGEEIYTDEFGRVKVQFHWDRYGKKNEHSSCWTRVSHPWAGKGWGAISTPRIGQEVVVDFLEGDPDQPIITGRVYNAEQTPPYDLPAHKTQSGVKSRSSMGGSSDNFNEIRFEDDKGKEQLFIHAEKNQDIEVENDETHWVGHDRKKTVDNNETVKIKVDRTEEVGSNETITIGADRKEKVGANETIDIAANRTETVGGNEAITVSGNQDVTVGGSQTDTVSGDVTHTFGGALTQTVAGGIKVTTPGQVLVTAAGGVTFIAPGGTKFVDNSFTFLGGTVHGTYAECVEAFPYHIELAGLNVAITGVNIEGQGLLNKKVDALIQNGTFHMAMNGGPRIQQAAIYLSKASTTLFT
jgi:type VI secretion system secreted protein VgrG